MEEEYQNSLKIYKEEKNKVLNQIKEFNGNFDEKKILLNNLTFLDEKIEYYNKKIFDGKIIFFLIYIR